MRLRRGWVTSWVAKSSSGEVGRRLVTEERVSKFHPTVGETMVGNYQAELRKCEHLKDTKKTKKKKKTELGPLKTLPTTQK